MLLPPLTWGLSGQPVVSNSSIDFQAVVKHRFSKPVFLTPSPDRTNRLFVVEQNGRIFIVEGDAVLPTPFLDIAEKLSTGGERGLLGLAFHPHYSENGRLFINYTRAEDRATVIAEYRASSNQNQAIQKESILLVIPPSHTGIIMVECWPLAPIGFSTSAWATAGLAAIQRITHRINTNSWASFSELMWISSAPL